MRLRRKPLYYVVNLIIPCCLLSVVAVGTFLLQPNCYDRLGLSTPMFTVSVCGFYVIKTVNAAVAVYTSKYKFSELKKMRNRDGIKSTGDKKWMALQM